MSSYPCRISRNRTAIALIASLQVTTAAFAVTYPTTFQITDKNAPGQLQVFLQDYAVAPNTAQSPTGTDRTAAQVSRINFMREDPANPNQFYVPDLNGNLYTLDKTTRQFTPVLNFASIFPNFDVNPGFAAGLVTVAFDPDYAVAGSPNFGKFYTTHTEDTGGGTAFREGVLTEWQTTDIQHISIANTTHHEMLTVDYNSNVHPLGDIVFNPTAKPGDPDYRMMYIAGGDGAAGESTTASTRIKDQMLNNYLGKILRIQSTNGIPAAGAADSATYTIPSDNPFFNTPGANKEIYAYGFRNPHRLSFDVNPQGAATLLVDDIGLNSYEEVDVVHKGGDYGYARIEGNQVLTPGATTVDATQLPITLPLLGASSTVPVTDVDHPNGTITPLYPVLEYSHRDGDAISSGFVYRGKLIPQLVGKYVFGDITTGRLFYSDYSAMLAADDGDPLTMASVHELQVFYNGQPIRIFDLVHSTFDLRNDGILDGDPLPGSADATNVNDPYGVAYSGHGRADIRLAMDGSGELYLISKSDGMIREILGSPVPEPASILMLGVVAPLLLRSRRVTPSPKK